VSELRVPGRETNNPLVVLNDHLGAITAAITALARPALPHTYALAQAELPQHGGVWGAYCVACSDEANGYVYPCRLAPEQPIKPPRFFTVGKAFEPRGDGAFLVFEDGVARSE
jgi:hypothetical protein